MCCCFYVGSLLSSAEAAEGRLGRRLPAPGTSGKRAEIAEKPGVGVKQDSGADAAPGRFPASHQELILEHVHARMPGLHSVLDAPPR